MSEIILHLSSGFGPKECEWVIARLAERFAKEAISEGLECQRVDINADTPGSILMRVKGRQSSDFVAARKGSIRWVGASPFRPNHKRKNWFAGVSRAPHITELPDLCETDITFQTLKASGPGGQHVNATESAVRATHMPTGISVTAREERSQHANKRLCLRKLALIFQEQKQSGLNAAQKEKWAQHKILERGNSVRTYTGEKFKPA